MKSVSVIVPNYNYARFLKRRLDSIVLQTVKPNEIIFLDDCSTDNSLELAKELLPQYGIPYQIITNETNQGVFKQWIKGIELVKHDIFWIAEADDYCELSFLEILLPAFDDEDIILSYCQSNYVLEGKIIQTHADFISMILDAKRWNNSYINNSLDEASRYLSAFSCIGNASAVLIRKTSVSSFDVHQILRYKMAGDWFFYLLLLYSNPSKNLAYTSKSLNYWTLHQNSVWGNKEKEKSGAFETLNIYQTILDKYNVEDSSKEIITNRLYTYPLQLTGNEEYTKEIFKTASLLGKENQKVLLEILIQNKVFTNLEFSKLHQVIADKDQVIADKDQVIADKDQVIADKDQVIADKDQVIADKDQVIADKDQVIADKDQVIADKDQVIADKDQVIAIIYNSKGWKLLQILYIIKEKVIPQGSFRRKLTFGIYNTLKALIKKMVQIKKLYHF